MALDINGYNDTFKAFVEFAKVGGKAIARVTDDINVEEGALAGHVVTASKTDSVRHMFNWFRSADNKAANNEVFAENSYYFRNALVRANYSNLPKGIEETAEYLERFFRNALLGEGNNLQSRYLLLGGWQEVSTHTSNGATHTSNNSSTHTSNRAGHTSNSGIRLSRAVKKLLLALNGEMTRAAVMKSVGIKNRPTFQEFYITPALKLGLVEMTQPNSPRSPTQKYRLTEKGKSLQAAQPTGNAPRKGGAK